jgi:toxin FitB
LSFLLDTMVLSELVRPQPDTGVVDWVEAQPEVSLFVSALTFGELIKGIERLPTSRRRSRLESWLHHDLRARFGGRILDIGLDVALAWGALEARTQRAGTPLPLIDGLLAATALTHRLAVVTRNGSHFEPTGVGVVDPWRQEHD